MNENWRILLALVLTIVVLFGWNFLFSPKEQQTKVNQERVSPQQEPLQQTKQTPEQQSKISQKDQRNRDDGIRNWSETFQEVTQGKRVTIDTPLYKAVINSQGGILEHFFLKKYDKTIKKDSQAIDLITKRSVLKAPLGILFHQNPTWTQGKWTIKGQNLHLHGVEKGHLTLTGHMKDFTLIRKFTFWADNYRFQEELLIENQREKAIQGPLAITLDSPKLVENESRFNRTNVIYYSPKGLKTEDDTDDLQKGIQSEGMVQWTGIDSNYFLLSMVPTNTDMYFKGNYEDTLYRIFLEKKIDVPSQTQDRIMIDYYLGPKLKSFLDNVPNNLRAAIHYGWLDIISKPLIEVLNFFYKYVGNYGIAIILLTVVIKILFWPLSHKSYKSMERMKKLQPMMKKLKEEFKDDRQKMNQELMRLYKTYKVNPAGGCLPMILQIPVFIGLYEALLGATELRHASFITHVPFTDIFWLADLSAKDPLYVTPVLMGVSMFLQQKLSPTAGDPMQAKIMLIMPIFLTFIFLNFPSGLVVYFITNNVLSIFQQWLMLRKA